MKQETGSIPDNHIIGVLKTRDIEPIRRELNEAGFSEVSFLTEEGVDQKVDPAAEHANPVIRLVYLFINHLSEQTAYLEQYEEEARKGNQVIAVRVDGEDNVDRAHEILQKYDVVDLRFFGKLAIKDLSPQTNPSAASDRRP